jgi:virulence-associated protein VapD
MIIVCLKGGLGNQLFQYAAGRQLAHIHNTIVKLDTTAYYYGGPRQFELRHFNIQENIATSQEIKKLTEVRQNRLQKLLHTILYNHPKLSPNHFRYNKTQYKADFLKLPDNIYLEGYWQSEKYFSDIKDILRQEFTFKQTPDETSQKLTNQITRVNSVSIHVRRGDYVEDSKAAQSHSLCQMQYYYDCIKYITQKVNNPHFFIFSDDIDWCRNNLKVLNDVKYVAHNRSDKAYEDLRLMSLCRHHIIANSSFSWWGAWLSTNNDKIVFAPKKWFASKNFNIDDIVPTGWIKI